ncbi:MAG: hypothetical protein AVDCRST_MAG95-284 [uncultured Adhaeribacter sp.]|uniref:Uncharacterized protein n=1 Tax=uncultured Adhaeribacter sp. TaxID=448109 RepID=A0A6J4H6B7_9BACT|nr:MAG: hypothetical protein AVDCRST_MAG95-284 [uncultured Adhaeribacter sp.]
MLVHRFIFYDWVLIKKQYRWFRAAYLFRVAAGYIAQRPGFRSVNQIYQLSG